MATRKPAKKSPVKATAKPVSVITRPLKNPAPMPAHAPDACCNHHGMLSCLCACCPIARIIFTRSFWAASVVAFLVIFATDWLLHTRFLMNDYTTTSALWRADGEISHGLIFLAQALTAMAYAAIVIGMGQAGRCWGSFSAGMLAASPVAVSAMVAYIMFPFATPYIPAVWAVAALAQGGLSGLAICGALRLSRAPEASSCCH